MRTTFVYVCTPDRLPQVWYSTRSLLDSGTAIGRIEVFLLGKRTHGWDDLGPRVNVRESAPIFGRYVYGNKVLLCELPPEERVVFLDTDTIVRAPLDDVWSDDGADFLARPALACMLPEWREDIWRATFSTVRASRLPMYNAGFLVFQRGAHRRIRDSWIEGIRAYLAQRFELPFPDIRTPEQLALSLAVSRCGLEVGELTPRQHVFGWQKGADLTGALIHTGNSSFEVLAEKLGATVRYGKAPQEYR